MNNSRRLWLRELKVHAAFGAVELTVHAAFRAVELKVHAAFGALELKVTPPSATRS